MGKMTSGTFGSGSSPNIYITWMAIPFPLATCKAPSSQRLIATVRILISGLNVSISWKRQKRGQVGPSKEQANYFLLEITIFQKMNKF
jgi:hypothetical protein